VKITLKDQYVPFANQMPELYLSLWLHIHHIVYRICNTPDKKWQKYSHNT